MSNVDRQKAYRNRKRNAQRDEGVTRVTKADPPSVETVPASPAAVEPVLTRQQARDALARHRASEAGNVCSCGKDTGHKLVVKCGPCCWGEVG